MRPAALDDPKWASLQHGHGLASDIDVLWSRLLSEGDPHGELGNMFCPQGTLTPAGIALAPCLVELAESSHPARTTAVRLLAWFVATPGGNVHMAKLLADNPKTVRFRDPRTGAAVVRTLTAEAPDPAALEAERAAILAIRVEAARLAQRLRRTWRDADSGWRSDVIVLSVACLRAGDDTIAWDQLLADSRDAAADAEERDAITAAIAKART